MKKGIMRVLGLTLAMLILPSFAFSQSLEEQRLLSQSKYNYLNDISFATNPQTNKADQVRNVTYALGLKYKLDAKTNLWAIGLINKSLNQEERFGLLDTILRYDRSISKLYGFNNRIRLSAILPTNERVHEQTSFEGAATLQLRSGKSIGGKFFLNLVNTLRWNFHEFRVSETAIPNIQATLNNNVLLSYGITPKTQAVLNLGWTTAKTYKNIFRDRYTIDLSVNYAIDSKLSTYAGFTTNAEPVSADGQESNLAVFDERDTTFYLGLSHFY